jgi:hypothetical protein
MRTAVLIAVASSAVVACAFPHERGSGTVKEESRPATAFHGVEASGAVEVHWRSGAPAISVRADDNLIGQLKTEVKGGTLRIYTEGHDVSFSHRPVINVSSAALDTIGLSGASLLDAKGVAGEKLSVESSGASHIELSGHVRSARLDLSGASQLALGGLTTEELRLDASGASSGTVHASRSVAAHLSGACRFTVAGRPPDVTRDLSGASSLSIE